MKRITAEKLKESIADALIALLKEKPINKIGISEIVSRANVSRASFYRHFKSKEDILYFKFILLADRWYSGLSEEITANPLMMTESFFQNATDTCDLLLIMHKAKLHHIVLQALYHIMRMDQPDMTSSQRYSRAFLAYGMFGILSEWISNGCTETPRQLAALTLQSLHIQGTSAPDAT